MIRLESSGLIAVTQRDLVPFRLCVPRSLAEAVAVMAQGDSVVPYAGGTDLCGQLREGLRIDTLVWLRHVGGLRAIMCSAGNLHIGAMSTFAEASRHAAMDNVPGLAEALGRIANVRVRWTATLGGNLMARRTRYELSILTTALDASLRFATAEGACELPSHAIWDGRRPAGAILERLSVPLAGAPRLDYERSLRPILTQALVLRGGQELPLSARAVIATEYLPPFAMNLDLGGVTGRDDLVGGAQGLAEDAFHALPDDFADPATGRDYLRKAGTALLARQIRRMAAR